jgi:hypothetical protein
MKRLLLPVLMMGLGFGLLATLPGTAAETAASPEKVSKLIEKMGSSDFEDREEAQKQLDAIGEPALEALKKAMSSEDIEVRRRAEELVKKIENRSASTKVLKPTKIHLVYKDTPLNEALADLRKKSGYNITLHDPDNKLKDRKVTVDTGEVAFWVAFDKFCAAAGLVDAKPEDLMPKVQPGQPVPPVGPGGPPIQIQPVPPVQIKPGIRPLPVEKDATPAQPADEKPAEKPQPKPIKRGTPQGLAAEEAPKAEPAQKGVAQPAQPVPGPAVQPGVIVKPIVRPGVVQQPGQIILVDGKAKEQATDYSTAVRVRALDKNDMFGPVGNGQIVLGLQVSPEPKITWQNFINLTVTKAVDDNDQTLEQVAQPGGPNVFPGGFGGPGGPGIGVLPIKGRPIGIGFGFAGVHQQLPVHLKKGAKPSKSLKELTGVIQAQVLAEPTAVITTDDVFKSAKKTFRGGENGSITIIEATKADNGQVKVRFEMQQPTDVVPAGNGGFNGGGFGGGGIGVPVPLPAPVPPGLPQGFQVQGQVQQIQIQVQAQPAVRVVVPPGGGIAAPAANVAGITVVDDKGNTIPVQQVLQQFVRDPNGARLEYTAVFQLPKGQDVAKLVYSGSRSVSVEIPFSLKNVTLP